MAIEGDTAFRAGPLFNLVCDVLEDRPYQHRHVRFEVYFTVAEWLMEQVALEGEGSIAELMEQVSARLRLLIGAE